MSMVFNSGGKEVKLRGSNGVERKGRDSQVPTALQSITGEVMRHVDGLSWPVEDEAQK